MLVKRFPKTSRQLKYAGSNSKESEAQSNDDHSRKHSISAPNPPQRGIATFACDRNLAGMDETPPNKNEDAPAQDFENLEERHLRFNVKMTGPQPIAAKPQPDVVGPRRWIC